MYQKNCPSCGSGNYVENYMVEDCKSCGLYLNYHSGKRSSVYERYIDGVYAQREEADKESYRQIYQEMWGEYPSE